LWVVAFYGAEFPHPSLLWSRLSLFFAVPLSAMFYVLSHALCHNALLWKKNTIRIAIALCVAVMFLTLSPYAFVSLEILPNGIGRPITGPGMLPFSIVTTSFSLSAILSLARELKKAAGILRRQIIFVLLGMVVTLGLIIGTIMVPLMVAGSVAFITYAPVYVLFFLAMVAVAVVRYHLFNIKLIATETLVAIMALIVIIEGFTAVSWEQFLLKEFLGLAIISVGYLLAKSVKKEISQREQMAVLNSSLEASNEQLKSANLRLEQLDRQKTEFLSIASHQLRTPLSIINGYVELLSEGGYGKMPKDSLPVFESITENTEHLIKLINEFLDITHIEQGKTKFFFEQTDVTG
jgi:signal transduction histidine kinase